MPISKTRQTISSRLVDLPLHSLFSPTPPDSLASRNTSLATEMTFCGPEGSRLFVLFQQNSLYLRQKRHAKHPVAPIRKEEFSIGAPGLGGSTRKDFAVACPLKGIFSGENNTRG